MSTGEPYNTPPDKVKINSYGKQSPAVAGHKDMTNFYTQNGWEGKNYQIGMSVKEIATEVRNYIKKEFAGQGLKFRVFKKDKSLYVALVEAPYEMPFTKEWADTHSFDVKHYSQHAHCEGVLIPELHVVFDKIKTFVLSYIQDDSDGMIDYFDRNCYDHYYLGTWEIPYKYTPLKMREAGTVEFNDNSIKIIDYSGHSIAVVGNTKPLKDILKNMGGKFNAHLSCGMGWIFSKSKKDIVTKALALQ